MKAFNEPKIRANPTERKREWDSSVPVPCLHGDVRTLLNSEVWRSARLMEGRLHICKNALESSALCWSDCVANCTESNYRLLNLHSKSLISH